MEREREGERGDDIMSRGIVTMDRDVGVTIVVVTIVAE